jgi:metal-responsive CopG/Arc/MetJ family transcriptional regulator
MNYFSCQLPEDLFAHLLAVAQREQLSETDLIIDALRKYLEKSEIYLAKSVSDDLVNLLTKET